MVKRHGSVNDEAPDGEYSARLELEQELEEVKRNEAHDQPHSTNTHFEDNVIGHPCGHCVSRSELSASHDCYESSYGHHHTITSMEVLVAPMPQNDEKKQNAMQGRVGCRLGAGKGDNGDY